MKREQNMPFTQQMQIKEANVRGVYLSIACDYERLMEDLILLCELHRVKSIENFKAKYLSELSMAQKLSRSKKALLKYNKIYYSSFLPHFKIIGNLVRYRNIMAHGHSNYDDTQKDKSYIDFDYVIKKKPKKINIKITPFISELEGYRHSIMELLGLTFTIRREKGLIA